MPWRKYHTIWFVMAFGWAALYMVRMGISPVLGMIMEEFHISYATAGSLFSAIFLSYTLMQVPSGYLGDRFGRRKILIISTLLWFFFSLGTALVQSFAMLVAVRFLTGFAHGAYFGNEKPTIVAFTPTEKMGQGQAVSFMGLAFGFFLAVFFSGMIADYTHNWRWVFVIFAFPSIITSFLVFKYVQDPKPVPKENATEIRGAYRKAFMGRDLWLMYTLGFTMLYAYWLLATWMPSIYMEMGISTITASSVLSGILGLVGLPGLFIIGTLSDAFSRRGGGAEVVCGRQCFDLGPFDVCHGLCGGDPGIQCLDHRSLFDFRVFCIRGMAAILCASGRTGAKRNRGDHIWFGQSDRVFEFLGRPVFYGMDKGYHRLFFGWSICGGFRVGGGDYFDSGG